MGCLPCKSDQQHWLDFCTLSVVHIATQKRLPPALLHTLPPLVYEPMLFLRHCLPSLLLIALVAVAVPGYAQSYRAVAQVTSAKSITIPARLDRKFRRDAARLALRNSIAGPDATRIAIDAQQATLFYEVLTTLYREQATARAIASCNVHTFPKPSIDHLVLIFERDAEWAEPLAESLLRTGDDDLNALLDEHDLIIEKHLVWDDALDAITIRAKAPLNIQALVSDFEAVDGVERIDLGTPDVIGNDIAIERSNNRWEVTYLLRFGALTGSPKEHRWIFAYEDNGRVQLLDESGDDVPSYMRCATEDTGWEDRIRRLR